MDYQEAKRLLHPDTTRDAIWEMVDKQEAINKINEACLVACEAIDELQEHRQLGTLEEVREAVEKQHPEEPMRDCVYKHQTRWCAKCKRIVIRRWKHCPICGQKLDWSEEND